MENDKYNWLKAKGYLHITAQIDVIKRRNEILAKVQDPAYISRYAFYPLIHATINERKYKAGGVAGARAHVHKDKYGNYVKTIKARPLHYATHMDAIIFGYYAAKLQKQYEDELAKYPALQEAVIAYRKIPLENDPINKSTIHFANEVFSEVRTRIAADGDAIVLAFDIKSFFSTLNHSILKTVWCKLFNWDRLPEDHYNVFKAATRFSYFLLDDLRIRKSSAYKKHGFDEKALAEIRNKQGINAFFSSPKEFRDRVKSGEIMLHKFPFRNSVGQPIGIPQGLPISAVLANLYLLDFDKAIMEELVVNKDCFYRRYSDDIIVVCKKSDAEMIKNFVSNKIAECEIAISTDKTEQFYFSKNTTSQIECIKTTNSGSLKSAPLIYLGFEFNGNNIRIKSSNLAKFYRRMIDSVKRKAKRARKEAEKRGTKPVIFRKQLYKLYTTKPLSKTKVYTRYKKLVKTETGEFRVVSQKKDKILRSNYLTYIQRASEIMGEPAIAKQIRNHKKIFNQAINRHLNKK